MEPRHIISLDQLLASGVHFGHQTRRWNPKMDSYIYTSRNGVHIIDLVQTAQLIDQAYRFMREATEQGKKVLFVGTKRQAAGIIAQEASRCGAYYVNQRWLGGMLTNWATIETRLERLRELERRKEAGALDMLPKKEASMLHRELEKLQKYLGGIKLMRQVPDIVVIVDQRREYNAVQECIKLDIPIVALLDTNCDPDVVDIPIPANDDAIRSIKLIIGRLADAIYEGRHGQLEEDDNDIYQDHEGNEGLEEEDSIAESDSDEREVIHQEDNSSNDKQADHEELGGHQTGDRSPNSLVEIKAANFHAIDRGSEIIQISDSRVVPDIDGNGILLRYLELDCPTKAIFAQSFTLVVRLLTRAPDTSPAMMIPIVDSASVEDFPEIQIVLRTKSFGIQGSHYKNVKIQRQDSSEASFVLTPLRLKKQEVRIDFYQNYRRIGTVSKYICVSTSKYVA